MIHRLAVLLSLASPGCRYFVRAPVSPAELSPREGAVAAGWTTLTRDALPLPIRAISALGGSAVAVIALDRAHLVDDDGAWPMCQGEIGYGDSLFEVAATPSYVLLLGARERRTTIWRSTRDDAECVPVDAPFVAVDERRQPPRLAARGDTAWAWDSAGSVARSNDEGRSWTQLPRLLGLERVLGGPNGETWAAVANGPAVDVPVAVRFRGRLARLDEQASPPQWRDVLEDRVLPMAAGQAGEGEWRVADADAVIDLGRDLEVRSHSWLPWTRSRDDAPTAITAAARGQFFALGGRQFYRVDDAGLHPLGTLPGASMPQLIDASDDGALWAVDARGLWQGGRELAWRERAHRPWSATSILAAAARGRRVAVATDSSQIVISADDGLSWDRVDVPAAQGRVVALAINARGTLLALCERGALMGDARGMTPIDAPSESGAMDERPSAHAIGDRWLILRGGVWSSDDDGARWVRRLSTTARMSNDERGVLALAVARERVLALASDYGLLSSDDAGGTWSSFGASGEGLFASRPRWNSGRPLLTWDGASQVAILSRRLLVHTTDRGARWNTRDLPAIAAAMRISSVGRIIVALQHRGAGAQLCENADGASLFVLTTGGFTLLRDACEHRGDAFAFDDERPDEAVIAQAAGLAWRARLSVLIDPSAPVSL